MMTAATTPRVAISRKSALSHGIALWEVIAGQARVMGLPINIDLLPDA
jgi:hypothetical protein